MVCVETVTLVWWYCRASSCCPCNEIFCDFAAVALFLFQLVCQPMMSGLVLQEPCIEDRSRLK